ncbi:MSF1-domain-containing protein [Atractiella rhizophila]|nr:MSF1-domain-containing protein [Atractiella rhizophila]
MLWSNTVEYGYPFHHVAYSLFQKYPNPSSPHVISVDVLSRDMLPTGILRTERLIGVEQSAPRWIVKLLGSSEKAFIREVTFVSLHPPPVPPPDSTPDNSPLVQRPSIIQASSNITMASILAVKELITYSPRGDQKTRFHTIADVRAGAGGNLVGTKMVRERVERFSLDRYEKNAEVGKVGFEGVLSRLKGWERETKERDLRFSSGLEGDVRISNRVEKEEETMDMDAKVEREIHIQTQRMV